LYSLDFIGDIHGHYTKFTQLLEKLGYRFNSQTKLFFHPEDRKIVVLGDFINVGMQNEEVLSCLQKMHQSGNAYIISGNHEYFLALLYHKTLFNKSTLWYYLQRDYFPLYITFNNKKSKLEDYIQWICQLPLFLDFDNTKAVHAIWDENFYPFLSENNSVKKMIEFIAVNPEYKENLNKTIMGITYKFKNEKRLKPVFFRYKWWESEKEIPVSQMFMHKSEHFPKELESEINFEHFQIKLQKEPVFFGHFNLQGFPYLTSPTKCCLDFGGAKGGYLTSYRWDGENILDAKKIVYV